MNKLTDTRNVTKITYLFMITYMVSYITRINYGAVISEMVEATSMSKSALSLALTGSFATYGAGQIISGICGDRFRPKKLVLYGLIATSLMNIIIPFCQSPILMLVVWSINGFAQAFMWPPMVKLMSDLFSLEEYQKACVIIARGSSFGTIIIYLISPVLIALSGWKTVFGFSALCGIVMIYFWNRLCPDINDTKTEPAKINRGQHGKGLSLFSPLMLSIMLAIILQGTLRDGVTTWMPSYISETYHLGSEISILTGVVLPVFSMICYQVASFLYKNKFCNPLSCAGVIFAAGTISALALYFLSDANAAFSVLFSAMLTGCMHGVNLMLVSILPRFFSKYGNVSTVSGVLNACTYIGSALSTYGIAVISENRGWHFTILLWVVIAALGTVVCLLCVKPWKKSAIAE